MPSLEAGLTGGIGAGKSTVARWLRELGLEVIDLDEIGRRLTDEDLELVKQIQTLCPTSVTQEDGHLDRPALRELFFSDPQVKRNVESLMHRAIGEHYTAEKKKHERVVCEAALLIESGRSKKIKPLIVVMADENVRIERVKKRNSWSEAQVRAVMKHQVSDEMRLSQADIILVNNGTIADLRDEFEDKILIPWREKKWVN